MKKISSSKINFIYNSIYQILLILIPLTTTPYISRVLGAEKIGEYSYSHAIAYYFVMFIMLGLGNYGNRTIAFVRDDKRKLSKTFCEIYRMQLITAAIVTTIYLLFAIATNNILTWIMLIYVVSAAIDVNWLFFGLEQFKFTVIRNSIIKFISTASVFIFVKNQDDLMIYALINMISTLISQAVLWTRIPKIIHLSKVKFKDVKKHIKPNLILFIPIIAVSLYKIMDKIMLGNMSDMEQVGFYESAEKIIQVPIALITSLGTIMMPRISNLVVKKENEKIRNYIKKSIYFAVFVSSSMCFGIMAIAKEFVPWYYGENYMPCVELFQILMPSCIFLAIANVIRTQYLIPHKEDKAFIISLLSGATINLIINALLIPSMGAKGAAIGTLFAEATVCILQIVITKKQIKTIATIIKSMAFVAIGTMMYMLISCMPQFNNSVIVDMVIKTLIGSAIYFIPALLILGLFKKKTKRLA